MKKKTIVFLLGSFFLFSCAAPVSEKDPVVYFLQGSALKSEAFEKEISGWESLKVKDILEKCFVRTREKSVMEIKLMDHIIQIGENTVFDFRGSEAFLQYGEIYVKSERPNEKFSIRTPTLHMGVRGTFFSVRVYRDESKGFITEVKVKEGKVFVKRDITVSPLYTDSVSALITEGMKAEISYADNEKTLKLIEKAEKQNLSPQETAVKAGIKPQYLSKTEEKSLETIEFESETLKYEDLKESLPLKEQKPLTPGEKSLEEAVKKGNTIESKTSKTPSGKKLNDRGEDELEDLMK